MSTDALPRSSSNKQHSSVGSASDHHSQGLWFDTRSAPKVMKTNDDSQRRADIIFQEFDERRLSDGFVRQSRFFPLGKGGNLATT